MQLSGPAAGASPTDIAELVRAGASALGHRPAVTVLHPEARYEQSGASIANWAVKGAHLLEIDYLIAAGQRVGLLAPPCWTTAGVALASWWLGAVVVLDAPGAVTVLYGDGEVEGDGRLRTPAGVDIDPDASLVVGDALDGAPLHSGELAVWTREAQPLPDHPPRARAGADLPALRVGQRTWNQGQLLALAGELGRVDGHGGDPGGGAGGSPDRRPGPVGVEAGVTDPVTALVATALRPLLTGATTVVLRGTARQAADQERVSAWL